MLNVTKAREMVVISQGRNKIATPLFCILSIKQKCKYLGTHTEKNILNWKTNTEDVRRR